MLFLSPHESALWRETGARLLEAPAGPRGSLPLLRPGLIAPFHFFAGTLLATHGHVALGAEWLENGATLEEPGMMSNELLAAFLKRHHNRFVMPATVFADPAPYVHFSTVPVMKSARGRFLVQCDRSLPDLTGPVRVLDVGTGNGMLLVELIRHLLATGRIREVGEILLIDRSAAMTDLARANVTTAFPGVTVRAINSRIEDFAARLDGHYDLCLNSLSYHHMPREQKVPHLRELRAHIDHFLLFELDANNDAPALHSPELALSVYQSYGCLVDFIFSHDAPVEVATHAVDAFLMTEMLSLLTQPRGERNDYHMLRHEWHETLAEGLGEEFSCLSDTNCHFDEYLALFGLHYGRV